jgi:hypothetical protein
MNICGGGSTGNLLRIRDVIEVEWDAGLGRQKSFGGNGKYGDGQKADNEKGGRASLDEEGIHLGLASKPVGALLSAM